ncbi:MAG: aspartate dehydrogenase [Clostridia bacterium]|nr:aspartate dehydrogenase [Clostridia bacterium]
MTPVIRCSICTGEQVAGFKRKKDGTFEEVMLLRDEGDLRQFREQYGIKGEIEKIY